MSPSLSKGLDWSPSACWAWACASIVASGGLTTELPESAWSLAPGYALGTLYPALQLAGGLAYTGRRISPWLPTLALLVGAGRGLAQAAGLPGMAHGAALAVEPAMVLAAAVLVLLAPLRAPLSLPQRLLPPALLALAGLEAASALAMLEGGPLPQPLLLAWVGGGGLLLALQLAAWGQVVRRDLERARDLLEQRVAEQTERYRTVSELTSDFAFAGRIGPGLDVMPEWITSAHARITGYRPEELTGQGWLAMIPPEERERTKQDTLAMLRGDIDEMQVRIVNRWGDERFLQLRAQTTQDLGDGCVRLIGAGRDVTESVRAEEEKRRLDGRLREMQRLESLGRLAGGIAHDFNNALTVILGNAKLALEEAAPGAAVEPRLRRIASSAEFASDLTEQILTYSGRAAVALEPLDLSALVADTLELLHAVLQGKASLDLHLPEGLPLVDADATQLRQVLVNLVTNAAQALGEEGGVIGVRTGARGLDEREIAESWGGGRAEPGHYVLLEVSDTGGGLDSAAQARIFEPFFTTKVAGRGLGLAAVLGITRAHGGVVRVESEPGRRTSFQVFLPRSARGAKVALPRPALAPGSGRILVVDDDEAVLEVAASFLSRAGFEVVSATSGRSALDLLSDPAVEVDAVVLDLVMPELSAEETLVALRRLRPELPVVLTSGYDREQAAQRFSERGIEDFVRKPYGPAELVAGVHSALARDRAA